MTEFTVLGKKVYLSPILDLYNQEIVSYQVGEHAQLSMVVTMLTDGIKRLKRGECPMLHSDQGWQYQMGAISRC